MGFSRLAASMDPPSPVAPAPTTVCSSSMNSTIRPVSPSLAALTSASTLFRRSSNSPRYLAPATREAMSRAISLVERSGAGTSPFTMRWARPSTMAVLPTPGSPIRTGLFLVRRHRTRMVRRISSSRPMTGSSLAARAVRSSPYLARASICWSPVSESTGRPPPAARISSRARVRDARVTPASSHAAATSLDSASRAVNRRSTPR